jgi:hypothetical protein
VWGNERRKAQTAHNPQQDTALSVELDTAEAQSLRQEITTRITLMNALIALELAALGTGLTAIAKPSFLLAALGAASSFLWLLWMDQSLYTYKIAAYLSVELAPRLSLLARRPVLGWETFLRRVESNGEKSGRALYPRTAGGGRQLVLCGRHAEWYVPLLFAATPPWLLALYVINSRGSLAPILTACFAAGSMWICTIIRFALLMHDINVLNDAIAMSETGGMEKPLSGTVAGAGSTSIDRLLIGRRPWPAAMRRPH